MVVSFGLAFSAPLFDRYAVDEVIACNQMQGQPTAIVRGAIDVIYALTKGTPTPLQSSFFSANHDQSTMPFSHCIDDNIIHCAKIEGKVSPQLSQFSDILNFVIYDTRKSDGEGGGWGGNIVHPGDVAYRDDRGEGLSINYLIADGG